MSLEGIDGSGKSTTAAEINHRLQLKNLSCIVLREPTEKTDASREIRRILRTSSNIDERTSRELGELFLIDRLWDLENQIKPALAQRKIVLLDRYYLSTAAYQSADKVSVAKIMADYLADTRILTPHLLIYLNLPVAEAIARLSGRAERDAFENEARLTRVSSLYQEAISIFREARSETKIIEKTSPLTGLDYEGFAETIFQISVT